MATELTPYERDVLRLRLGLDSGEGKTVREVVEICGGGVTMSGMFLLHPVYFTSFSYGTCHYLLVIISHDHFYPLLVFHASISINTPSPCHPSD